MRHLCVSCFLQGLQVSGGLIVHISIFVPEPFPKQMCKIIRDSEGTPPPPPFQGRGSPPNYSDIGGSMPVSYIFSLFLRNCVPSPLLAAQNKFSLSFSSGMVATREDARPHVTTNLVNQQNLAWCNFLELSYHLSSTIVRHPLHGMYAAWPLARRDLAKLILYRCPGSRSTPSRCERRIIRRGHAQVTVLFEMLPTD